MSCCRWPWALAGQVLSLLWRDGVSRHWWRFLVWCRIKDLAPVANLFEVVHNLVHRRRRTRKKSSVVKELERGFRSLFPLQIRSRSPNRRQQKKEATLPFFVSTRRDSKAVMQRIANPSSPVRLRIAPPPSPSPDSRTRRADPLACENACSAPLVKLVDTADLKSAAFLKRGVPVRSRPGVPVS